ncbi:hypothetical protein BSR29_06630 [Boudabousia liubingyangii]|uniref:Uncharacterized protein n=1 Tax=Boudabousia liubingyangii TaxID=1921764 RepID=A0A1Q5PKX6_9ACTO|nr:DUF5719 family protein [Boudabousia liubingyangii]OKL47286.1 hypothetical protein BSR29_06630 [Boudabousia liubingyangii]
MREETRIVTVIKALVALVVLVAMTIGGWILATRPAAQTRLVPSIPVEAAAGTLQEVCLPLPANIAQVRNNPDGSTSAPEIDQILAYQAESTKSAVDPKNSAFEPIELETSDAGIISLNYRAAWDKSEGGAFLSLDACQPAADYFSFTVPGSEQISQRATLMMVNPSANSSSITLEAWNTSGDLLKGQAYTLRGNEKLEISIDSLVNTKEAYQLELKIQGPKIAAGVYLQRTQGLSSLGQEWLPQNPQPSEQLQLLGIDLSDAPARLELANPGDEEATVSLKIGPNGTDTFKGLNEIKVPSRAVLELDLAGLPIGAQVFELKSKTPIIAQVVAHSNTPSEQAQNRPKIVSGTFPSDKKNIGMSIYSPAHGVTAVDIPIASGYETQITIRNLAQKSEIKINGAEQHLEPGQVLRAPLTQSTKIEASNPVLISLTVMNKEIPSLRGTINLGSLSGSQGRVSIR